MNKIAKRMYDKNIGAFTMLREAPPSPTLEEDIRGLNSHLSDWFDEADAITLHAYKRAVSEAITGDDENANRSLADSLPHTLEVISDERMRAHAVQAVVQLVLAEQAIASASLAPASEQEFERQRARDFTANAKHYWLAVDNHLWDALKAHANVERASKAGKKSSSVQYDSARQECIRLLKLMRPPEGWVSFEHAAQCLAPAMREFIEAHPKLRMSPDAHKRMLTWFRENTDIRRVFYDQQD